MSDIQTQICVVGAGAAGITLTRALLALGHQVLLLESGDTDYNQAVQDLYIGENLGAQYYELDHARLRFFGGTTNIWGGRCVPLTSLDYQQREWVPHSGWPINGEMLDPYLQQAHEHFQLGSYQYGQSLWAELGDTDPFASDTTLQSWFWRFDEVRERFGWEAARDLRANVNLHLMLNTNLVQINVDSNATRVTSLDVASMSGERNRVLAEHYVLACGGIENPRLLMAATAVEPQGVGNGHDQVGRYFMEHPHARVGYAETSHAFALWYASRKRKGPAGIPIAPAFALTEAQQQLKASLNNAVTFKLQSTSYERPSLDRRVYLKLKHDLSPAKKQRALWHVYRSGRDLYHASLRPWVERVRAARGQTKLSVILRAEQAPNPASRVLLGESRDALGMQRAALDWQMTALDKHSAQVMAATFDELFARSNLGRFVSADWLSDPGNTWPVDPTIGNHPIGGYHHMGTTRMSNNPSDGVVDANCTVHGYSNMHIAGSSVFPTAGWANPTLTILALSLRLAEHLHALTDA